MKIVKKHLDSSQYYPRQYEKKSIFLHHTAGTTAKGAWSWWNQTPARVGTAYIVDRDGTIWECFEPEAYGFHLGVKGDDNWQEKHSVGIELVSAGGVYKEGEEFIFYPLFPNKSAITIIPKDEVAECKWKGFDYFHKYTDAQIEATVELIEFLSKKFDIKIQEKIGDIFEFDQSVIDEHKSGLFTHNTVRKDKVDTFPQRELVEALIKKFSKVDVVLPEMTIKPSKRRKKK